MIEGILSGSWDQPTASIVMHDTQPTKLQDLAAHFTEKAGVLVDLNERALQLRTGGQRGGDDEEGGRYQDNFNQRRWGLTEFRVSRKTRNYICGYADSKRRLISACFIFPIFQGWPYQHGVSIGVAWTNLNSLPRVLCLKSQSELASPNILQP